MGNAMPIWECQHEFCSFETIDGRAAWTHKHDTGHEVTVRG